MKLGVRFVMVLLVVLVAIQGLTAADEIFIRDILDNPHQFYNQQVTIQGTVSDRREAPDPNERAYYILMDASDKSIKIVADSLPAVEDSMSVLAIVQVDPVSQEPFLREVSRQPLQDALLGELKNGAPVMGKKNGFWITVGILSALIVIVLAVLLAVIFKKPGAVEGETFEQDQHLTKQVNLEEIQEEIGALKTKQVPARLAELRVVNGKFAGKSFPMGFETKIGRIQGDITLEDASVSREHAVIAFVEKGYVLKNISQTNPAILNGERISAPKSLKDGDEIVLGIIKLEFKTL